MLCEAYRRYVAPRCCINFETGRSVISRPPSHVGHHVTRLRAGSWSEDDDVLAAEEPLEIRLVWQDASGQTQRKNIAVTMRTPGDDFELAAGFLHGEGILRRREDVVDIAYCTDEDELQALNIVTVTLAPSLHFDPSRLERNFYTTSSCGVCGKAALENIETQGCEALPAGFSVSSNLLSSLPARLRESQAVFERTGGLHAAGLFDADGTLISLREDVGRHNAVDKLIGEALLAGDTPLTDRVLMLSGRASFELLQKALVAHIPVVAAVGAPSSLAVELAESFNVTLCGFVRADGFNLYTAPERVSS
jgi:FdhD protein